MEEKKFPWLLRLLSANSSCVPMLDTYALHKEKIVSSFVNDSNYVLTHRSTKCLPQTSVFPLLDNISSQTQGFSSSAIKHVFFLYKSQRKEVSQSLLKSFTTHKKPVPPVSYVQTSRISLKSEVNWEIEFIKTGYKSKIKPETVSLTILEQAKEISKVLISLIELHENKKVLKLSLEFLLDNTLKLVLSYMPLCVLGPKERIIQNMNENLYTKSNELSDIVNELSSPSKILKRRPSLIRTLERQNSYLSKIEIDSPVLHQHHNSSESETSSSASEIEHKNQNKTGKIDKNFLEILCKTRIVQNSRLKKYFISENELKDEKEKIVGIIEERSRNRKIGAESALELRSSVEFTGQDGGKGKNSQIMRTVGRRTGSMENLALPVLSVRAQKNLIKFRKCYM